jgi:2-oxoglutarate dehydrogenase E2 component (dihydrolipoamide succinyltransferase)
LTQIVVPEGETVNVGTTLAVIGDGQVSGGAAPAAETAPPQPAVQQAPPPMPAPPQPAVQQAPPPMPAPPQPAVQQAPPPDAGTEEDSLLLSPMVRRLLADNGIDSAQVHGTGLGGRITREDVLAYIDTQRANGRAGAPTVNQQQAPPPEAQAAPPTPPPPPPPPPAAPPQQQPAQSQTAPAQPPFQAAPPPPPPGFAAASSAPVPTAQRALTTPAATDRVVPFSNVRRRTAEHMVRSKSTSPHAFIAAETDFENVERVRRAQGPRFKAEEGFSLTYLPFVARASVEALREFPQLNASVVEDSLVVHGEINLGIAVDLDFEGLIVPVIHRAEEITLRGIARRVRDLADRARTRQLTADDIVGGTFSITNDGPFGTYFTVPIINQPQVAILATDGIKRRPVVIAGADGSESIAIHSVGVLGMSWDHRAVDGAYVSSYLHRVGEVLGTRDWAAVL